jgi:hypothetical protein
MADDDLRNNKYDAHLKAVEAHQSLLEKLHLNTDVHLDEINNSIENLTITLEEYLKVIGIP